MNCITRRGFIVGTILLLLISDINGSYVRRRKRETSRESGNDLNWQAILNDVRKIPIVGQSFYKGLEDFGIMVNRVDKLTNGALSRIAGGYPPCTIDLDGVSCNGDPKDGGIVEITQDLINSTPLPGLAKKMIIDILDALFFPTFDMIVGIPESAGKKA